MAERQINDDSKLDKNKVQYCQAASKFFWELVDEDPCDDWRSVRARVAVRRGVDLDSRSPKPIGGNSHNL